jgi:predicted nucleotidyltransferase
MKFIKMILGIALVATAGYLLLKDNSFSYKMSDLSLIRRNIASVASTTVGNIKAKTANTFSGITNQLETKAVNTFSGITNQLQAKAEDIMSSSVDAAKKNAFNNFRQEVENGINKLGEKAGIANISINNTDIPIDKTIIYPSIKRNINTYFTIRNNDSDILKYQVDWLDGSSLSSGELTSKNESVLLTHRWSKAGDYLLNFNVTNSSGSKIYKVSILVLD